MPSWPATKSAPRPARRAGPPGTSRATARSPAAARTQELNRHRSHGKAANTNSSPAAIKPLQALRRPAPTDIGTASGVNAAPVGSLTPMAVPLSLPPVTASVASISSSLARTRSGSAGKASTRVSATVPLGTTGAPASVRPPSRSDGQWPSRAAAASHAPRCAFGSWPTRRSGRSSSSATTGRSSKP
jgi:hypothetical protein